MSEEKDILKATFYGLYIYRHILGRFYPGKEVLKVEKGACLPVCNPFNENKPTLTIYRGDYVYMFRDEELMDFKGNPFDFAAVYYRLSGHELFMKINEEMKLNALKPEGLAKGRKGKENENEYIKALPHFTFFRAPISNTKPYKDVTVLDVYKVIKGGYYEKRTEEFRAIEDKIIARIFKAKNFDYVCFAGSFSKRGDKFLKQHSNLMVLDFDDLTKVEEVKLALLADPFFDTELLFISPSGNGLKWVIAIDTDESSHEEWFKATSDYLLKTYGLIADKSGKDVSRACFMPFDPDIYINPQYLGPEYQ